MPNKFSESGSVIMRNNCFHGQLLSGNL
jgi:hypothetical protein